MSVKALVGISIAFLLILGACATGPASPTAANTPAQTSAVPPVTPLPTVPGTPGKAEELREAAATTAAGGEEAVEGAPVPNPLPTVAAGADQTYAPVPGVDATTNGAAASIHGSPTAGRIVFDQNCQACHGANGKGGLANAGSDDGSVPPLDPIDPGFIEAAKGDPATLAREIDLYIQHGSRPAGTSPTLSMIPWGDQKKLTQQQIADVEAYVMQLNGVSWPSQ